MALRYKRSVLGLVAVSLLLCSGAFAQEAKWNELQKLTSKLMSERRFQDALRTGEMGIVIAENTWGADSIRVADGLNNLAILYFYVDQPDRAESAYRRAIEIYDEQLGSKHFKSLNAHKSLARLCQARGKLDFAKRHYVDAVAIAEKRFGPAHPVTEEVLYNLAMLLMGEGNMAGAEGLLRRILSVRFKRYGGHHIRVAEILKSLIQVYMALEVYDGLDAVAQRVMEIEAANMPRDDPRMIDTHMDLANIYRVTDRPTLAEPYYDRALRLQEQHEGPDYYPDQASYTNFARVTMHGTSLESVLLTWNQPIGKDHVARMTVLDRLGEVIARQGNQAEAVPFYDRSLAIAERAYGPDHHITATAVKNLAEAYYALGDTEAAKPLYERIAHLCDRAREENSDALQQYLGVLSQIYFMEKRYVETAETYRKVIALQRKALGDNHPQVASTMNNLAEVERLLEHNDEAEKFYLGAIDIYEGTGDTPPSTTGLRVALTNLARFYEQTNRSELARPYRRRLNALSSSTSSPSTILLP